MESPLKIDLRRQILEWRDRFSLDATVTLNRLWLDLRPSVVEQLEGVGWRSALVEPSAYIRREIDPLLIENFAPAIDRLISAAGDELVGIVKHELELDPTIAPSGAEEHWSALEKLVQF